MKTTHTKTNITVRITDHEPILGHRGIKFRPEEMTVTKYPNGRYGNERVYAILTGTRILKSGELGNSKHYLSLTVIAQEGDRPYELDDLKTLQATDPELAAEIERYAAIVDGLA